MNSEVAWFLRVIVVGLGATLFMDLWALFVNRAFGAAAASYCSVGRWLLYMPEGTFIHRNIATSSRKRFECTTGWVAHYVIGASYAVVFMAFVSSAWLGQPTVVPAVLFGIGSVVVPFLVMQPAFGLGIAGSRTPSPTRTRLKSLMAHASFGVGLYVSAAWVSYILRAMPR